MPELSSLFGGTAGALTWDGAGNAAADFDSGAFAPVSGNRVIALGDSLTAGTPNARHDITFPLGENYFSYAVLASAGRIVPLHNAGTGGETSTQIVARLAAEIARGPDAIVCMMGTNDVYNSVPVATVKANFATFVTTCRTAGVLPVIVGLPPTSGAGLKTGYAQINAWLRSWCPRNNVPFIDAQRLLVDATNGSFASGYDSGDTIHITSLAMKVIGNAVAAQLAYVLPPRTAIGSTYSGDPTNMLLNGMFTAGTTTPTNWSLLQASGAYTVQNIAEDLTLGIGKVAGILVQDTGFAQFSQGVSTGFTPGDVLAISGKVRHAGSGSVDVYLACTGATDGVGAGDRKIIRLSTPAEGSFYVEYTVPTGTTTVTTRLRVTGTVAGCTGSFAELSMVNLDTQAVT